ncbi:MAG: hypothetical protein COV67_10415, partial [Nitrospinae bacterium CG11_big_fil_rev_8_21_14_0_20_56_8]
MDLHPFCYMIGAITLDRIPAPMKLSEVLALRKKKDGDKGTKSVTASASVPERAPLADKALKVLRTRETPNPNALQFVLNTQILDYGNRSYSSKSESSHDKMASALFDLGDIESVYVMENFVTVTKVVETKWGLIKDRVWKTIDQLAAVYPPAKKADAGNIDVVNFPALSEPEKLQAIEMVLNRSIRSNLARDGGGVQVKGIEGNIVRILYQGACGSCPTSTT